MLRGGGGICDLNWNFADLPSFQWDVIASLTEASLMARSSLAHLHYQSVDVAQSVKLDPRVDSSLLVLD